MSEEKKHKIIVKYRLYGDSHVRARFFMGPQGEEKPSNLGSLLFSLDEFEALREILQKGLKEYRNAELEFREVENIGGKDAECT